MRKARTNISHEEKAVRAKLASQEMEYQQTVYVKHTLFFDAYQLWNAYRAKWLEIPRQKWPDATVNEERRLKKICYDLSLEVGAARDELEKFRNNLIEEYPNWIQWRSMCVLHMQKTTRI